MSDTKQIDPAALITAPVANPDPRTVDGQEKDEQIQLFTEEGRLANAGLLDGDQPNFCDHPPEVIKPFKGAWEKFLNWARSESLWILGFGTGCGAIELRPLMTSRFDMYRYGIQPVRLRVSPASSLSGATPRSRP